MLRTEGPAARVRGSVHSPQYSILRYFLKLGATGFGGPIALAEYMKRDLVERQAWFTQEEYLRGLTLAQLAPGPLATQLAVYLGFIRGGAWGGALAGTCFILPSFLLVLGVAVAYAHFGGLHWVQAGFYGVGAAVIGIIARSAYKLTRSTVGAKRVLWLIFGLMAATTLLTRRENVWLFLVCGFANIAAEAGSGLGLAAFLPWIGWLAPEGGTAASGGLLLKILLFFSKASAFVFGSGLAIVPFLYGGVVKDFHWLTDRQFLDAVAVAMMTPGPVTITAAFIGYLVAGTAGALVACCGNFLPVYFFVVIPASWMSRYGGHPKVRAFVHGVTAAAMGALCGAAFLLARTAVHDWTTAAIALGSLAALIWIRLPEPVLVAIAWALGLLLYPGLR